MPASAQAAYQERQARERDVGRVQPVSSPAVAGGRQFPWTLQKQPAEFADCERFADKAESPVCVAGVALCIGSSARASRIATSAGW
jgi:hypothetical protein